MRFYGQKTVEALLTSETLIKFVQCNELKNCLVSRIPSRNSTIFHLLSK